MHCALGKASADVAVDVTGHGRPWKASLQDYTFAAQLSIFYPFLRTTFAFAELAANRGSLDFNLVSAAMLNDDYHSIINLNPDLRHLGTCARLPFLEGGKLPTVAHQHLIG